MPEPPEPYEVPQLRTFRAYIEAYAAWLSAQVNEGVFPFESLEPALNFAIESYQKGVPLEQLPEYGVVTDHTSVGVARRTAILADKIKQAYQLGQEEYLKTRKITQDITLAGAKEYKARLEARGRAEKAGRLRMLASDQPSALQPPGATTEQIAAGAPSVEQVYQKQLAGVSPQLRKAFETELGGVYAQFEAEKGVGAREKWFEALHGFAEWQTSRARRTPEAYLQTARAGLNQAIQNQLSEARIEGYQPGYIPGGVLSPAAAAAYKGVREAKAGVAKAQAVGGAGGWTPLVLPPPDPWEAYLKQYPFLHKYLSVPPRERGVRTVQYRPPAIWG